MTPGLTTRLLVAGAGAFWFVDASMAALHWPEPLRSISQAVAVTTSVLAGIFYARDWERDRHRPEPPAPRMTYVSTHALHDVEAITMEIPRPRVAGGAPAALGANVASMPPAVAGKIYRLGRVSGMHRRS